MHRLSKEDQINAATVDNEIAKELLKFQVEKLRRRSCCCVGCICIGNTKLERINMKNLMIENEL